MLAYIVLQMQHFGKKKCRPYKYCRRRQYMCRYSRHNLSLATLYTDIDTFFQCSDMYSYLGRQHLNKLLLKILWTNFNQIKTSILSFSAIVLKSCTRKIYSSSDLHYRAESKANPLIVCRSSVCLFVCLYLFKNQWGEFHSKLAQCRLGSNEGPHPFFKEIW